MMPQFVEPIVTYTVRNYLNLHHSQLLRQYKGPVHFIRRTQDEVMNLDGQHRLESNLGNQLIEDFFQTRYPKLFETEESTNQTSEVLWSWFTAPDTRDRDEIAASWNLDAKECESIVQNYIFQHPLSTYPIDLGHDLSQVQKIQVLLYLVNKHVACYPSTHCTPLPPSYFTQPWKIGGNHQSGSDSANSSDFELINSQTVDY
uniref:Uncharacterized protein n=1 Tax=Ciona savignyi TaxID=51511 RepID=H2YBH9_CIOSA